MMFSNVLSLLLQGIPGPAGPAGQKGDMGSKGDTVWTKGHWVSGMGKLNLMNFLNIKDKQISKTEKVKFY